MKRKCTFVLVTLFIAAFTLAGCGNGGEQSEDPIKLGVIGPMSGDFSMYGGQVRDGALLAAEEINAAGGIDGQDIEIVYYDTKGDGAEAVNAYNKLINQDNIVGLVGGTFSGETLAIKELAVADGLPVITPTATHLDVTVDAPNIFRACYTDPYQGSTVAKFAIEDLNAQTAAVMYNIEDAYSEGLAVAFKEAFEDAGLTVTQYEGYTGTQADYSSILTKIKDANPDVIFLPDYTAAVGKITTQIQNIGIESIALGGDGWDGIEADYADQVEGYYFANHYAKSDQAEIVQNFISSFESKFGVTPNALAALGYDSVKIMAEGIKAAGSTDSAAVVESLTSISVAGVAGTVTFDGNGDAEDKEISMIKLVSGQHVLIKKVSLD